MAENPSAPLLSNFLLHSNSLCLLLLLLPLFSAWGVAATLSTCIRDLLGCSFVGDNLPEVLCDFIQ
jgi:hypothetical protein